MKKQSGSTVALYNQLPLCFTSSSTFWEVHPKYVAVSMDENNVNQKKKKKKGIKLKQIFTAEKLRNMQYALQCQKNSLIKPLQYNARFKPIL